MLALICRVAVAAAFLVAAVYKWRIAGWASQTASAMKLPLVPVRAAPAAELVVGAALLVDAPGAAWAAVAMLVAYTAVLVPRVGGPPCACFGRAAKPITWVTVARNMGLIALLIVSVAA